MFLTIAIMGFARGAFFLNFFSDKGEPFRLFSAGIIPLCNIAIGFFKVSAGLFAMFCTMVFLKIVVKNKSQGDTWECIEVFYNDDIKNPIDTN